MVFLFLEGILGGFLAHRHEEKAEIRGSGEWSASHGSAHVMTAVFFVSGTLPDFVVGCFG